MWSFYVAIGVACFGIFFSLDWLIFNNTNKNINGSVKCLLIRSNGSPQQLGVRISLYPHVHIVFEPGREQMFEFGIWYNHNNMLWTIILFSQHVHFFLRKVVLWPSIKIKCTTPCWTNATRGVKQKHRHNLGNSSLSHDGLTWKSPYIEFFR